VSVGKDFDMNRCC